MEKNCTARGFFFGVIVVLLLVIHSFVGSSNSTGCVLQGPFPGSELLPGDLLFMDLVNGSIMENDLVQNIRSNDHVALYVGERLDAPGYWCISAGLTGTSYGVNFVLLINYTDPTRYENLTIGRVITANHTQRENAITWAIEQRYAEYQRWYVNLGPLQLPRPLKCANPHHHFLATADEWYCSELVWAAYYNTSNHTIDIDSNGWGCRPWVIPSVNMGVPVSGLWPGWLQNVHLPLSAYAYKNELQIDDDILLLPWT